MKQSILLPHAGACLAAMLIACGSQAGETGSAALIPLSAPPLAGVLAIGSRDPDRFHEGKSVDFLQRLAEVVSVTLQSAAGPGV